LIALPVVLLVVAACGLAVEATWPGGLCLEQAGARTAEQTTAGAPKPRSGDLVMKS
jgi:hypothetical protein